MDRSACRNRGFTLIELLMGLAILAVLAALAAPAYGNLIGRTRSQTARSELDVAMNQARLGAVSRGAHAIACPSGDGQNCSRTTQWHHGWLVFADLDHDGAHSADEPVLSVARAQAAGVAILSTRGRTRVDYQPDGSAGGTNLTLTICDRATGATRASTLVINQSGRIRRGTPTPEGAAACMRAAG